MYNGIQTRKRCLFATFRGLFLPRGLAQSFTLPGFVSKLKFYLCFWREAGFFRMFIPFSNYFSESIEEHELRAKTILRNNFIGNCTRVKMSD